MKLIEWLRPWLQEARDDLPSQLLAALFCALVLAFSLQGWSHQ